MVIFDNPATVPAPFGQYSHVARVELGDRTLLQLSGQVAIDADGKVIGNDMATQAEYIMDRITAILAAHGATLSDVVNVRAYLTDMSQLPEYGKVRAAHFQTPPTITTVEGSQLFVPARFLRSRCLRLPESRSLRQRPAARLAGRVLPGPVNAPWEVTAGPHHRNSAVLKDPPCSQGEPEIGKDDMTPSPVLRSRYRPVTTCKRAGRALRPAGGGR